VEEAIYCSPLHSVCLLANRDGETRKEMVYFILSVLMKKSLFLFRASASIVIAKYDATDEVCLLLLHACFSRCCGVMYRTLLRLLQFYKSRLSVRPRTLEWSSEARHHAFSGRQFEASCCCCCCLLSQVATLCSKDR
jgi:hypothetical protein